MNMLDALSSPILLKGDAKTAYRDPAILYQGGIFYLYYTLMEIEDDGHIYGYTAQSISTNLVEWSSPQKLTPRDQALNYSSPGNVIRFNNEWILCLQTYPRPDYTVDQIPRYGDETARLFIMRSRDLITWSEPELLRVKGPDVPVGEMGRMIDPYLLEDKEKPGLWWCFYKQNGVSMSYSRDLENWTYHGHTRSGENVCVLVEENESNQQEYILFHSPRNGIGIKRSADLVNWRDWGDLITLGQNGWTWAKGRITAGAVINLTDVPSVEKYLMFFHGSGPHSEQVNFDNNASIGIAWSDDLLNWSWPSSASNIHQETGAAWDIIAQGGYSGEVDADIEFIRNGGNHLMPVERRLLDGLDEWCETAVHLQCSGGKDLLSLWNMGAKELIGIDISETLIGYARAKAKALNAPATWYCCDVLDTPAELNGTADLVYTGKGALMWMMDLDAWAAVVARLLKPNGRVFIFEGHPLDNLWDRGAEAFQLREDGASYHPNGPTENPGFPASAATRESGNDLNRPQMLERCWRPGQVINALAAAGLQYVHFDEYPELFWNQFEQIPQEQADRLPHTYSVFMGSNSTH